MTLRLISMVALGGGVGALLRFGLQAGLMGVSPHFPYGTMLANILGSFAIGLIFPMLDWLPVDTKPFLLTGLLGSLTTLSSLKIEVLVLIEEQKHLAAFAHWFVGAFVCLLFCAVGLWFGRHFAA